MKLPVDYRPNRVISLIPSMTATLFDLGLDDVVVGITDYCVYPFEKVQKVNRIGGPKNPDHERIVQLHPDLVILDVEENSEETLRYLKDHGIPTWVIFPKTVRDAVSDLWVLVEMMRSVTARERVQVLEATLEWQEMVEFPKPIRYFCPVWSDIDSDGQRWWMTFNQDTYSSDLLKLLGGENIFKDRQRRYPLSADLGKTAAENLPQKDTRYPRVSAEEIRNGSPDLILLPGEPYCFKEEDAEILLAALKGIPIFHSRRIYHVQGEWLFWHGTFLARSLINLPQYFE